MADDDPLQCLVNEIITDVILIQDYVQLTAGNGIRLSIYNDFSLPMEACLTDLVGKRILSVSCSDTDVTIYVEGRSKLIVDLRDSAFKGPEAMQLDRAGRHLIVWN